MNNQNINKNFLFYSNHCQHSRKLTEDLSKTPLINSLLLCCVDDPNIVIPPFITSVPSIYLKNERKILVEDQLYHWMNIQLTIMQQQMSQQMSQQMPQQNNNQGQMMSNQGRMLPNQGGMMPNQNNTQNNSNTVQQNGQPENSEIMAFHNSEMGASFSDSYSFIENATDNPIHHSYSFISGGGNLPTAGSINTPKEDGNNDTSNSRKVNKSSRLDQKYEEMLNQRQNEMKSSLQNMRM